MSRALRITKVGKSAAILLPKEVLARLCVGIGDTLVVGYTPNGITLSPQDQELSDGMVAEDIMREDSEILAALAGSRR